MAFIYFICGQWPQMLLGLNFKKNGTKTKCFDDFSNKVEVTKSQMNTHSGAGLGPCTVCLPPPAVWPNAYRVAYPRMSDYRLQVL